MPSKQQVLDRLAAMIRLKGQQHETERSYCRTASHFYDFALTCPKEWTSEQKAEAFLTKRVTVDNVSASTQNHDLAALNALYESVGKKLGNVDALRAKRPRFERHCPSREEVVALLRALVDTPTIPAKLVGMLLYGCGLRVNEALELRLKDVRLSESRLVIRAPKHGHDRVVPVPCELFPAIKAQMEFAKRVFDLDQKRNPPLPLQVPGALAKKYPRAPYSLAWSFLFPSLGPQRHPRTGVSMRWHLRDREIQRAFAVAREAAGIFSTITPHCMRHGFGTHFEGDVRDLQAILGHKSLETTQTYRHPHLDRARSPIVGLMPALGVGT